VHGGPFDDDFLALDGDVDRLVLGVDLLADADLARLDRMLLGVQPLFLDLDRLALTGGRVRRGALGVRGGGRGGRADALPPGIDVVRPVLPEDGGGLVGAAVAVTVTMVRPASNSP